MLTPDLVARCLDAETGRLIWKRDLMKQHHGRNIHWKSAASVAVDGDLVFVAGGGPGESLLGLNKDTGAVVWKTGDERITHSTPVVATIHDQRQVIFFLQSGLVSVDSQERQIPLEVSLPLQRLHGDLARRLRRHRLPVGRLRRRQPRPAASTKQGGRFTATKLWFSHGNEPVASHWSTPVCKDGYLYGMFGFKQFKKGPMKCVELATGKVMWSQANFGQGNVILVGKRLVALAEDGSLVIVEATPDGLQGDRPHQAVPRQVLDHARLCRREDLRPQHQPRRLLRREREVTATCPKETT